MNMVKQEVPNGFEKLAYYFDKDNNGVIKGAELKPLKLWVDIDGDGQTDKGELQTLKQHGITEIVVPRKGQMTSSTKVEELKEKTKSYKGGGAKINLKELDQSELPSGYEYPAEVVQPDMSKKLPEQDEQTALATDKGSKVHLISRMQFAAARGTDLSSYKASISKEHKRQAEKNSR